jgi:hypothetical protein
MGRYSGHIAQDYLKARFIRYAITYFDLTHTQNTEEYEYLVRLTRELMTTKHVNIQFTYDCLSACRGKMEKEEYNSMVRRAKFETRFLIEQINKEISKRKELNNTMIKETEHNKVVDEAMAAQTLNALESSLADFEALRVR